MKRLLHYLKAHPVITVMAPLFKMLEATFELLVPLVVAQIIDTGIAGNNGPYLWKMGGLLIVLGVVGFAFSLTAQYFAAKSAVSAGMAMRSDLFAHLNTFPYQEIDALGPSPLPNRPPPPSRPRAAPCSPTSPPSPTRTPTPSAPPPSSP